MKGTCGGGDNGDCVGVDLYVGVDGEADSGDGDDG
jgi:hypothetical protein